MIDISGNGTTVTILAIQSFPIGFTISEFADDVDPLVAEPIEPTGFEMLYDGSLFAFDKAAPIKVSVGVVAGSNDDINLKILLQARQGTKSLLPVGDVTSMVISYGAGGRVILSDGVLLSGPIADSIQTSGRKKGNTYEFVFGSFAGAQSTTQIIASIAQAAGAL